MCVQGAPNPTHPLIAEQYGMVRGGRWSSEDFFVTFSLELSGKGVITEKSSLARFEVDVSFQSCSMHAMDGDYWAIFSISTLV